MKVLLQIVRCRKLAGCGFQNVSSFSVGLIFRKGGARAKESTSWKRALDPNNELVAFHTVVLSSFLVSLPGKCYDHSQLLAQEPMMQDTE